MASGSQNDRNLNVAEYYQEILRKKSFAQKWEQTCALREIAWRLKTARLRSQNPEWSDSQVKEAVRKIFLYGST